MTQPLGDAAERARILDDLEVNLVVEAAAGTGKTTCLVGRLMNLFRRGALSGAARLAAVTFTHKAAAELRERLDRELERALADPDAADDERANLTAAEAALPECHIGTIHSFCARILREHPVEAGLSPGFRELDDDADLAYRRAAWREFSMLVRDGGHPDLFRTFEVFGLDLDSLGQGFETFAEHPDVDAWPGGGDMPGPDAVAAFVVAVRNWHGRLGDLPEKAESADPGTDRLIPVIQILNRRLPGLYDTADLPDAWRLCRLLPDIDDKDVKVLHWKKTFAMKADAAREIGRGYQDFCRESLMPFRTACRAAAYSAATQAFQAARDIYDRLRRLDGVANFQDLLLAASGQLRSFPAVRAELALRYARLLVDEVQDTDPVQAEIMFLLADAGGKERNWRKCRPRPGSLFIVGDPKQSIYRFRRADITVYQEVKRLIASSGGETLGLTTNFRSQPCIIDWVNRTFLLPADSTLSPEAMAMSGKFAVRETPYSPAYVPLRAGRAAAGPEVFSGVYFLETRPVKKGEPKLTSIQDEAARIARFIRDAVDRGLLIPAQDGARPAVPADFMIVTYQKPAARHYTAAVRRLGLDCQLSGGSSLADSRELDMLIDYLSVLSAPDDPVALAAALRGPLFGVSVRELYRWKKAGGAFSFLAPPLEPAGGNASGIAGAMAMFSGHHRILRRHDPVLALERIVDDLGLWPAACLGDDPAGTAGTLATAIELLRRERADLPTLGDLRERLLHLLENYEEAPLPVREMDGSAVRVMNLHKTKGLEAAVVFLTSTSGQRGRAANFALRRREDGPEAGLSVMVGQHDAICLARPGNWEEMAAEEELFLAAERTRLRYVAATRAGAALVVSLHEASGSRKSAFLPEFIEDETITEALPEPENDLSADAGNGAGADGALAEIDAGRLDALSAARDASREEMLRSGVRTERAKENAVPAGPGRKTSAAPYEQEFAADFGEVLHGLLASGLDGEEARALALRLLREHGLSEERLDSALELASGARESEVWQRAESAAEKFREAPFTIRLEEEGRPVLQRGVIDLVFREPAGWVIVDYKSDRIEEGADLSMEALRHAGQLSAYARAWLRISGAAVVEAGIYFLRTRTYVPVPAALEGNLP